MDARLDTLIDELCQVNTRIGRTARRQAQLGGFIPSSSPFPEASANEDSDDGAYVDEDASSSSDEKMTTS